VILDLLVMKDRFPDIWMPSTEQRDLRTLLRDRHQWVKMRARLQHTLQAIALNHALREGRALWTAAGRRALQDLALPPYSAQRRGELLTLYTQLEKRIQQLDKQVETEAQQRPRARRLLTHPGVGPVTALATEVFLGDPTRFATANQVASYIGMIPCEHSSGKKQRLGKLTKEGNSLLRYLWVEATLQNSSVGEKHPMWRQKGDHERDGFQVSMLLLCGCQRGVTCASGYRRQEFMQS
jgi:transposase